MLTCSSPPHNPDFLSRADGEAHALQDERQPLAIRQLDILEDNFSLLGPGGGRVVRRRQVSFGRQLRVVQHSFDGVEILLVLCIR